MGKELITMLMVLDMKVNGIYYQAMNKIKKSIKSVYEFDKTQYNNT